MDARYIEDECVARFVASIRAPMKMMSGGHMAIDSPSPATLQTRLRSLEPTPFLLGFFNA